MDSQEDICVPVGALAMGEDGSTPQQGDTGSAQVDFTVSRVEGDNAYLTIDKVNGEPVMDEGADEEAAEGEGGGEGEGEGGGGNIEQMVKNERAKEGMP